MRSLQRRDAEGFTLIELLVVIGIVAILAAVVILVLNPAELLKQARDSNRSSDLDTLRRGFQFVEAQTGGTFDLDGPTYTGSCRNGAAPKIFVSVPADNGEATATAPLGWQFVRVPNAQMRNIDGTGWIPVDMREEATKTSPPFSAFPVDPVNTFASALYYSYVCGSYEFNAVMESKKYAAQGAGDGGDNDNVIESGSDLTITPPRTIPGVTSLVVTGILPINGKKDTTVTSVEISGGGFESGATVRLTRSGYTDVSGSGFSFISSSTLGSGQFNLTSVATGTWDVVVQNNPSLAVATLSGGFTVTDPAIAAPTVTSINPVSANRGTTVTGASIVGTGFQSNSTVKLQKTGQSTITASGFTFTDSAHLNAISFTIPGSAASGTWDVVVQNPDTQFGTLAGGFTINAPPPITMTASSSAVVASSTVLNWNHDIGAGTNRLLLVGVSFWNGSSESISVKLDGTTSLTQVGSATSASGDKAQMWSLLNPPTGTHSIDITATGQVHIVAGATSWINVDQADPLGTFSSAIGSGASPTVNVSSAQGEVIQDVLAYFGFANPGSGQSLLWRTGTGQEYGVGSTKNGNSSVSMSWSITASSTWALGAVPIKLAP